MSLLDVKSLIALDNKFVSGKLSLGPAIMCSNLWQVHAHTVFDKNPQNLASLRHPVAELQGGKSLSLMKGAHHRFRRAQMKTEGIGDLKFLRLWNPFQVEGLLNSK